MKILDFLCFVFALITFLIGDCGCLTTGCLFAPGDAVGTAAGFNIAKHSIIVIVLPTPLANAYLIRRFSRIKKAAGAS